MKEDREFIKVYYKKGKGNSVLISSKIKMFQTDYIIAKVDDHTIRFSVPTLDYQGKLYKLTKAKSALGWKLFGIADGRIKAGILYVDEEDSTEDEIVIYFTQD